MGKNKYPLTGIRFTPEDKERIAFISKHTEHKTATAIIHVALQGYATAVQKRLDSQQKTTC